MFEVEKGIAPPAHAKQRGRPPVYPFATMDVGDSVVITGGAGERQAAVDRAHKLMGADKRAGKVPRRYATQKIAPNQTRIWRIE